MAQVIKKLQPGGTISSAKTFGWNGHQIEANEENLNKLASASPIAAQMVKDGYQINWDSNTQNLNHVTPEGKYNVKALGKELRNMKNIDFISKQDPIYKLDLSDQIKLKYIQSGDNIVLADTPETEAFLDRVKYFISGGEGAKKYDEYDLSSTSFNDIESAFKYWADPTRQTYFSAETKDENGNTFVDRVKKGIATSQDVEYLNSMGIKYSDSTDVDPSLSRQNSDIKKKLKQYGLDPKYESRFVIDQDGDITIPNVGNVVFNDEVMSTFGTNDHDFLKGSIVYNGHVYSSSDLWNPNSQLYKYLDHAGYYDALKMGNYDAANNILRINNEDSEWSKYDPSDSHYHEFFDSEEAKNYIYNELTGKYSKGKNQLLRYYDPSNVELDEYGRPKSYNYAEFDENGKFITTYTPETFKTSGWKQTFGGNTVAFNDTVSKEWMSGDLQGFYKVGIEGAPEGLEVFKNPNNEVIRFKISDELLGNNKDYSNLKGKIVEIPDWLKNHVSLKILAEIFSNSEKSESFLKLLNDPKKHTKRRLKRIFGKDEGKNIYTVISQFKKDGGVIPKAQEGMKITGPWINPSNAAELTGKNAFKGMDDTDWADLGALAADLGAFVLTAVPGYGNAAGAAVGLGGTAASIYSDIARDGFQLGDVGRGLMNIGLDIATVIPGLGTGAKGLKIAKNVKRLIPVLTRYASIAGLGAGFKTVIDKLGNGEPLTINDARVLLGGLQGASNLKKIGVTNPYKTKSTAKLKSRFKNGKLEINLSDSEMKNISELPKSKQADKLAEILLKKAKEKKPDIDLKKENVLEYFNVDLKADWWNPMTWKEGAPKLKEKTKGTTNLFERPKPSKIQQFLGVDMDKRHAYNQYLLTGRTPHKDYRLEGVKHVPADLPKTGSPILSKNGFERVERLVPNITQEQLNLARAGKAKTKKQKTAKNQAKEIIRQEQKNPTKVVYETRQTPIQVNKLKLATKNVPKEVIRRENAWNSLENPFKRAKREVKYGGLALPSITSKDFWIAPIYQEQVPLIYKPSYKKGGVLKGQTGLQIWTPKLRTSQEQLLHDWANRAFQNNSTSEIRDDIKFWDSEKPTFDNTKLKDQTQPVIEDPKFYDIFSQIVSPDTLLKAGSFIGSIAGADKIRQYQHETAENVAKAKLKTHVDLGTPRYDQSVLDRNLSDQLKTIQSVPVISTDQNATNAANLQKAEMENAARTQYNQELAKYRSDYLSQKQAIDDQNRVTRQAIEDHNRSVGFEEAASKAQADAAFETQKTQSALNLMYEERAKLAKLEQMKKQYADWITQQNIQVEAQNEAQQYLTSNFSDIWAPDKELYKKYGGDALKYLQAEQPERYKQLMKEHMYKLYSNRYNSELENYGLYSMDPRFQLPDLDKLNIPITPGQDVISSKNPYLKKGGKIRSTGDQMLIDQNKATHRLVSKLNDNVIELFYKTK